jgi:hypothetical protein
VTTVGSVEPGKRPSGIAILTTVPLQVGPSKKKKFAIGGSRAANAFSISWPSIPPITAQLGVHSLAAVVDKYLYERLI